MGLAFFCHFCGRLRPLQLGSHFRFVVACGLATASTCTCTCTSTSTRTTAATCTESHQLHISIHVITTHVVIIAIIIAIHIATHTSAMHHRVGGVVGHQSGRTVVHSVSMVY
jgi:hypothetical protein